MLNLDSVDKGKEKMFEFRIGFEVSVELLDVAVKELASSILSSDKDLY